jgi:hypothetical protein
VRVDALPFWRDDHFPSTSATASISKSEADKAMMHLLGFGSAEVGPRAANEFENKTARTRARTIGWVIGGHQTTNSVGNLQTLRECCKAAHQRTVSAAWDVCLRFRWSGSDGRQALWCYARDHPRPVHLGTGSGCAPGLVFVAPADDRNALATTAGGIVLAG